MSNESFLEQQSDAEYLRDLCDRVMAIPIMYGVDQYDCERLLEIASKQPKGE
jgi:hypothetical protein